MFISLGFLVSLDPANLPKVMTIAQSHAMSAVKIGSVDANSSLRLQYQGDERVMFDWSTGPILTPKGGSSPS